MTLYKNKYRVESARLKGFDYSSPGGYFVTINTKMMLCWFGDVVDGEMQLSSIGEIVANEWLKTPTIRSNVLLDEWKVMPNHLHGIVVIGESPTVIAETHNSASLHSDNPKSNAFGPQLHNLGSIIRGFKSAATNRIHTAGGEKFAWQPRFHDHIIRDDSELNRIREYIINNPLMWYYDKANPKNIKIQHE